MNEQPALSNWLLGQPLVLLAIGGLLLAGLGWRLEQRNRRIGDFLRHAGYVGLALAGMLIVIDAARQAGRSDAQLEMLNTTRAEISGSETVIPLGPDEHYDVIAVINGKEVEMLIDTGATYTTVDQTTARRLDLTPDTAALPSQVITANGTVEARFGRAEKFNLGSIEAANLQVAIMPDTGNRQGVIGMNLLNQLASWRVEDRKLYLQPKSAAGSGGQ